LNKSILTCILKPVKRTLVAIFFSLVFISFLTPMELGDFWWHLSTGKWIIEHMRIPTEDIFSFTSASGKNVSFVISAFWLCQVVYACVDKFFGLYGIVAFKALTFTLTFLVAIRFGRGSIAAYVATLPAIYVGTFYDESRPQTFSFLFFAAALYLLENARTAYREDREIPKITYALPLLMVIWANVHPGFVIGIPLIAAYAAEAIALASFKRPRPRIGLIIAICVVSAAVSALNPNVFDAAVRTLQMLKSRPSIHEHLPLKEFADFTGGEGLYPAIVSLIVLGAASFVARFAIKRRVPDILHLAVFAVLAVMALKTFRAGFFFAIFAVAVTGRNLSDIPPPSSLGAVLKKPIAKLGAAAALLAAIALLLVPRTLFVKPMLTEGIFPERAATFIEKEKLPPNIYNPYEWGGYLIWRLYPDYKVFVDSRGIGAVKEHSQVLQARPGWEKVLDKHGVNTVLFWPLLPYRSDVPPIIMELQMQDDWRPVYWDTRCLIYVRSELAKNPISKRAVWELLTSLLLANMDKDPGNPANYISLGEIYELRGLHSLAEAQFRKALTLDPQNERAAFDLESLQLGN